MYINIFDAYTMHFIDLLPFKNVLRALNVLRLKEDVVLDAAADATTDVVR